MPEETSDTISTSTIEQALKRSREADAHRRRGRLVPRSDPALRELLSAVADATADEFFDENHALVLSSMPPDGDDEPGETAP